MATRAAKQSSGWTIARAIVSGVAVALLAGSALFALLYPLNVRWHPELPWLALGELAWVAVLLTWLNGWGPPRASAKARRHHLRLWRGAQSWPRNWPADAWWVIGAILALNLVYLAAATAAPHPPPDLRPYPTTALRWSAFIMSSLLSGVGEEAGVRGVMQSQLDRFGPAFAIGVSSLVFVLGHLNHGWAVVPLLPGYFLVSVLYGVLAWRTGSILPSAVLHVLGDWADAWFIVLGGNGALLFAG